MQKTICPACYGKKYYSVYQWWMWWFTDFWQMEYINIKNKGIEKHPCKKCNWLWYLLSDNKKNGTRIYTECVKLNQ